MSLEDNQDAWKISKGVAKRLEERPGINESKLSARMNKFFLYNHQIEVESQPCANTYRVNLGDPEVQIVQNKLSIFGVSPLSNQEIKKLFNATSAKRLSKDLSSACVEFGSTAELEEAVRKLSVDPEQLVEIAATQVYELKYQYKKTEHTMFARYTVNTDFKQEPDINVKQYIDQRSKMIYFEQERRMREAELPRRKLIRKNADQQRFVGPERENKRFQRGQDQQDQEILSSLESFKKRPEEAISNASFMEEELSQNFGQSMQNPISIDLDLSVIKNQSESRVPKIYSEPTTSYKFKTFSHKDRFKEKSMNNVQSTFTYKKYFEEEEQKQNKSANNIQMMIIPQ